jgi:hypothetical protein
MPVDKYFGGHGAEVMARMIREYGEQKGKQVFYTTVNARKVKRKRRRIKRP